MKTILLFASLLIVSFTYSQDLFIKSYNSPQNLYKFDKIESFNNGDIIIAGGSIRTQTISSKVYIRYLNPCGEELWSKEINELNTNIDFTDLHIDSNQHIILTTRWSPTSTVSLPTILKFNRDGSLIYSKQVSSSNGYNSLLHSSDIAPNGDYIFMTLYRYHPSPPNVSNYALTRMKPDGTIKWSKRYTGFFPWKWGVAGAGKDNGVIVNMSDLFFKTDSLGNLKWAKTYHTFHDNRKPIATDSGFVFPRYYLGGLDRGGAFCLGFDGSVKWSTNSFLNFYTYQGILRKNGNILLPGIDPLSSNTLSFMEINSNNGSTISLKRLKNNNLNGITPVDLAENNSNNVFFIGHDDRGILKQISVGKLTDSLTTVSCTDSLIAPTVDPFTVSFNKDSALTAFTITDLTTSNYNIGITNIPLSNSFSSCQFTKPRGSYMLGNDTSLCIGQSLTLGNNTNEFDSYLWSNGSTNKTIGVNQTGTYWLQVVSACDTLRDSIQVNYIPGILFSLGKDTISCEDSITLGSQLNPSNYYTWSTGETTTSIEVKTSGIYWVEHATKCHTFRDSINVFFQPKLDPIALGNDTILCPKSTILLGDLTSPYETFLWSDSSNFKALLVNSPGLYWLNASNICNSSRDSIQVYYYPEIGLDLGMDQYICKNQLLVIRPSKQFSNYKWSTGATTPSIVTSVPGIYWLEIETNCGPVRDSITVELIPDLAIPNLGNDTSICFNQSLQLDAISTVNYIWSTGETSSSIQASSGIYWLEYFNECDTIRDSIIITELPRINPMVIISPDQVKSKDTLLFVHNSSSGLNPTWDFGDGNTAIGDSVLHSYSFAGTYLVNLTVNNLHNCFESTDTIIIVDPQNYLIPNIFTPNNDLLNDQFKPYGNDIKSYSIKIFDNWGKMVFEESNIPWNGRNRNQQKASEGVYKYIITLEFYHGTKLNRSGTVSLIR